MKKNTEKNIDNNETIIIEKYNSIEQAKKETSLLTRNDEKFEQLRKKYPNKEIMLIPSKIGFNLVAMDYKKDDK